MLLFLTLTGCVPEQGTIVLPKRLESFPYVDAGAVAPLDRRSFIVPLFSLDRAPVRIYDMQITDYSTGGVSDVFLLDDSWRSVDSDGDGTKDAVDLEAYNEDSDEDTLALPVVFAPPDKGFYSAEMTIWSDDNQTLEKAPLPSNPDQELGIWKVQLRGISADPCSRVLPLFIDFGQRPSAGQFTEDLTIENCGLVTLDVAQADFEGTIQGSVESGTLYPLYVLPGETALIDIRYTASASAVSGTLSFVSNAPDLSTQVVTILGNECEGSADEGWDVDNDGWTSCGGDCNDADYSVSPSQVERAGNGSDDDCDGEIDEAANPTSSDDDLDGCSEIGTGTGCNSGIDCDDNDPDIGPQAVEIADRIDNNCDGNIDEGTDWVDDDGDGYSEREGDCNDASLLVGAAVTETTDSQDNDCDGLIDEGGPDFDDDGDGLTENQGDCDDGDPWTYTDAFEFCDDYDNDCDKVSDEGSIGTDNDGEEGGACAFIPEREELP
jgi:hypothetical protein